MHGLQVTVTSCARGLLAYARTGVSYDALNEKVVASSQGLGVTTAWLWRTINEIAESERNG